MSLSPSYIQQIISPLTSFETSDKLDTHSDFLAWQEELEVMIFWQPTLEAMMINQDPSVYLRLVPNEADRLQLEAAVFQLLKRNMTFDVLKKTWNRGNSARQFYESVKTKFPPPTIAQLNKLVAPISRFYVNQNMDIVKGAVAFQEAHRVNQRYMEGVEIPEEFILRFYLSMVTRLDHDIVVAVQQGELKSIDDLVSYCVHFKGMKEYTASQLYADKDCTPSALVVNKKKDKCNKRKSAKEKKCFTCNGIGHFKPNCPNNKQRCDKCGGNGHVSSECDIEKKTDEVPYELNKWVVSSSASVHICNDPSLFRNFRLVSVPVHGLTSSTSLGQGEVVIQLGKITITLQNVHYVPDIPNLVSVPAAVENNSGSFTFDDVGVLQDGERIATLDKNMNLYVSNAEPEMGDGSAVRLLNTGSHSVNMTYMQAHRAVGHPGPVVERETLKRMYPQIKQTTETCRACVIGKADQHYPKLLDSTEVTAPVAFEPW